MLVDLRELLGAEDSVIPFIFEDLCASLRPSLRSFVENFRVGLNEAVNVSLCAGSISFQFHGDTAIDGITHRFSEGVALEDGGCSTKGEDVIDRRLIIVLIHRSFRDVL